MLLGIETMPEPEVDLLLLPGLSPKMFGPLTSQEHFSGGRAAVTALETVSMSRPRVGLHV